MSKGVFKYSQYACLTIVFVVLIGSTKTHALLLMFLFICLFAS